MKRMKRIISISIALLLAGSALADTYRVSSLRKESSWFLRLLRKY